MSNIKKFRIKSFKTDEKILKIEKLSFKIKNKVILDNLDLNLNRGEILGLLGPNGAGKSSLFNLIIGILKPNSGSILINQTKINDYPIHLRSRQFKIGIVPQNGGFFYDLSVYENLKSIYEITSNDNLNLKEKINTLLDQFELNNIRDLKADFLSGGQKKKLVIAMALISNPKILLLDEPFAALDIMTIQMIQKIIVNLQSNFDVSIILCDHQARDLLNCVDKAAIINDGKVIAEDNPSNLIKNIHAKKAYFGDFFKIS